MGKRKEILHLASDEIAVVWHVEEWRHLVLCYEMLAEDATPEDKPYWLDAAAHIRNAIEAQVTEDDSWQK